MWDKTQCDGEDETSNRQNSRRSTSSSVEMSEQQPLLERPLHQPLLERPLTRGYEVV